MARFLIDANLPYRFSLWHDAEFLHVFDLNERWTDDQIWAHARDNNLTIVSKDADFSDRMILVRPPPRVIHLRIGNTSISGLHEFLNSNWPRVRHLSESNKLVRVYIDRIESIA